MKTKFLFAMCAASLLAACTNEELISTRENDIAKRAVVDVTLGADMGSYTLGDASTRTSWQDGSYYWEAGDKLGACLLDGAGAGTPQYNNIFTNYPFYPENEITTPVKAANFKTNTAVYEGVYVFYHKYNAEMTKAKTLEVNFPVSQEMDAEKPYAHLTTDNFFVSPLIKIVDGIAFEATNTIPVQFTSLYSGFAPTLKNTSNAEVKVSKVEVYSTTGFKLGGNINTVTSAFGAVVESDNENLKDAIATKLEAMRVGSVDLYQGVSPTAESMVSITLPDITIAAGGSQEIRMLFPAGSYGADDLKMKVYTNKGVFSTSVSGKAQVFNRDAFKIADYEMDEFKFPSEFSIFNKNDWDYAVKFVNDNAWYKNHTAVFSLENDITLEETSDIPAYSIYVDVKSGKKLIVDKENAEFAFAEDSYIAALEVAAKTALNLDGKSFINSLTNKGTVNVLTGATVESKAAKADYDTWKAAGAEFYGVAALVNSGEIEVEGRLGLGTVAPTLSAGTITNNGTLAIVGNVTNNAKIVNNGVLTVANGVILTNEVEKEITLGAGSTVKCEATSAASVITNKGIITLAEVKDVFRDKDGNATATSLVTKNGAGATSVAITPSSALADLAGIQEVNSVTISGEWNKAAIDKIDAATSVTGLILNGATVDAKDFSVVSGSETLKAITAITVLSGENTIKTTGSIAAVFGKKAETLAVNADATLTVDKNIKFGVYSDTGVATITVLGDLVNSGSIAGNITVGASAPENTSASIVNNEGANLIAASALSTVNFTMATITNYGSIENLGNLYATSVDNKIVGKSTFIGNIKATSATTSNF